MIAALAFILFENLKNALAFLNYYLPDELILILDYFEDNYVGRMQRNQHR